MLAQQQEQRALTRGEMAALHQCGLNLNDALVEMYETLSECGLIQQISTQPLSEELDHLVKGITEYAKAGRA